MATDRSFPTKEEWAESAARSPDDFDVEDTPMTDEQAHRLKALCWQRGERFNDSLSADEAERRITELEARG